MATAQQIVSELEGLLEGLGFGIVEVQQDHNYGAGKASIELPTTEYSLGNLRGDYKADGSAVIVMVQADQRRGILRRNRTVTEFTKLDELVALGKPDSADYLNLQSALQDFTDELRRRITATFEVGWTQEKVTDGTDLHRTSPAPDGRPGRGRRQQPH